MNSRKKAFTLIEIVIVLLIMGFIYTIGISSFSKQTIQEDGYHFSLKHFLQDTLKVYDKKIELIVLDDFNIVRINDDKSTDMKFSLPKDIEFYSYWSDDKQKEHFKSYYDDEYFKDVKFRFVIYKNKTATKCIIKKDDRYHIQSNYFTNENVFEDLYDAQTYLLNSNIRNSMVLADD